MTGRLQTLVIKNFRSLRGTVAIPLDAPVVLVHGSNGMGKTSVLSALELALTGQISHLAGRGEKYKDYLLNLGTSEGSIDLVRNGEKATGTVALTGTGFRATPLLSGDDARYFSERCYLPQATLGRLLEIYNNNSTHSASPLTLFVKELLRLEPLDALIGGLYPAFHVARVRTVAPSFREFESIRLSLRDDVDRLDTKIRELSFTAEQRRRIVAEMLANEFGEKYSTDSRDALVAARDELERWRRDDNQLNTSVRRKAEILTAIARWNSRLSVAEGIDRAERERKLEDATTALARWQSTEGATLADVLEQVRRLIPSVRPLEDGPETARIDALRKASSEAERCQASITAADAADARLQTAQETIQRSSDRIAEITSALAQSVADARSLAGALAGVAPHILEDKCPVCDRDFSELGGGQLTVHIAGKIASLTSEAGRLQALATARATESNRLAIAQREHLSAAQGAMSAELRAAAEARRAHTSSLAQQLTSFDKIAESGVSLLSAVQRARQAASAARQAEQIEGELYPQLDRLVTETTGKPLSTFPSISDAASEAIRLVEKSIRTAEEMLARFAGAITDINICLGELDELGKLREQRESRSARLSQLQAASRRVDIARDRGKVIANAALVLRTGIVRKVFSASLNKTWRDLFVRLAPSEQFVPMFRVPTDEKGDVEVVLETIHKSGARSGSPTEMLSQGNLNTAALTLFLALHLSVPPRLPWLVLDDPVQSMDDVHIAQFAALLRTLSKGLGRQVIIAVHERELFDYLMLELSPAFAGDSLVAVEVSRNFEGDTVAPPKQLVFEPDQAIAA